jgi:hypothetical protein
MSRKSEENPADEDLKIAEPRLRYIARTWKQRKEPWRTGNIGNRCFRFQVFGSHMVLIKRRPFQLILNWSSGAIGVKIYM